MEVEKESFSKEQGDTPLCKEGLWWQASYFTPATKRALFEHLFTQTEVKTNEEGILKISQRKIMVQKAGVCKEEKIKGLANGKLGWRFKIT